jgi:trans-aconitate methyltransferase
VRHRLGALYAGRAGLHAAGMGLAQQFGHPSGLLGRVVGRVMARGNAALSRWVVEQAAAHLDGPAARVAELGPGPGVGLATLLAELPDAQVWGIEPSSLMRAQSQRRNRSDVASGRLVLVEGDVSALGVVAPADLVVANHVLYFWQDPAAEMTRARAALRPGGVLALGYQLRKDMPQMAQKRFPEAGHRLYDADEQVGALLREAGFSSVEHVVKGPADAPEGRVALATA